MTKDRAPETAPERRGDSRDGGIEEKLDWIMEVLGMEAKMERIIVALDMSAKLDQIIELLEKREKKTFTCFRGNAWKDADIAILAAVLEMSSNPKYQYEYKIRKRKQGQPQLDAILEEEGVYCGAVAWLLNEDGIKMTGKGVAEACKRMGLVVATDKRHRTNGTPILWDDDRFAVLEEEMGLR